MFNSFPIPFPDTSGGSPNLQDWSAYTPVYNLTGTTTSVAATTWNTFVDVSGKGFFKWCRLDTSNTATTANPAIRITIDGVAYLFDTSNSGNLNQGNEVNFIIPFNTSLKIEGYNRAVGAALLRCDYLYFLKRSTPSKNNTALSQSQRKMAYITGTSITLVDLVNVTGSGYLLGIRFLNYYNTAIGFVLGDIAIDGVNKMSDRPMLRQGADNYKQTDFIGPIRFDSSLLVKTRTDNAGTPYTCFAWYTTD